MTVLLLPGCINPSTCAPFTVQEASVCQSRDMARLLLSDLFPRSNCDENRQGYCQGLETDRCIFNRGPEPSSQRSSPGMH